MSFIEKIKYEGNEISVLNYEGVNHLHELLSNNVDLLEDMDPVQPPGIKNPDMLASAVGKQFTGSGEFLLYNDCFKSCAALVYGVTKNHAFHNGNKRTGLLTLIKHLYVNGYVLNARLSKGEVYDFILNISKDNLKELADQKYRHFYSLNKSKKLIWDTDTSIAFIAFWLKKNTVPKIKTQRGALRISLLRDALIAKGIELEQNGRSIKLYVPKESSGLLGLFKKIERVNERNYPMSANNEVSGSTIRRIRKDYNLTFSEGVDNAAFYDDANFLDKEIKTYKSIIYRLSRT